MVGDVARTSSGSLCSFRADSFFAVFAQCAQVARARLAQALRGCAEDALRRARDSSRLLDGGEDVASSFEEPRSECGAFRPSPGMP